MIWTYWKRLLCPVLRLLPAKGNYLHLRVQNPYFQSRLLNQKQYLELIWLTFPKSMLNVRWIGARSAKSVLVSQDFSVDARDCFALFIDTPISTIAPLTTANRVKIKSPVTIPRCVVRKSAKFSDCAASLLVCSLNLLLRLLLSLHLWIIPHSFVPSNPLTSPNLCFSITLRFRMRGGSAFLGLLSSILLHHWR